MQNDSITERQYQYLVALVEQRDYSSLPLGQREFLDKPEEFTRMTKGQASAAIGLLRDCPYKPKPTAVENNSAVEGFDEVIEGRYFIVDPTDNVEKFFKVDKPTEGRWAGYTFLKVQASDDFYAIKERGHREAVLAEIAKDPVTAMNEYGIRLGRCGKCGRTLTAKDSRLRGLGPICAGRVRQLHQIELSVEDIQNLLKGKEDE